MIFGEIRLLKIPFIVVLLTGICQLGFSQDENSIDRRFIRGNQNGMGVVGVNDSVIIPFEYNWIVPLKPNNFAVEKDKLYALYDIKGNQLSQFKYSTIDQFHEGIAVFTLPKGKYGYINEAGAELFSELFDHAKALYHGRAAIYNDSVHYRIYRSAFDCFNNKTVSKESAILIAKRKNYYDYHEYQYKWSRWRTKIQSRGSDVFIIQMRKDACCWEIRSAIHYSESGYAWFTYRHIWIDMNSGKVVDKGKGKSIPRRIHR